MARGICDAAAATGKPIVASFLPEAVTTEAVAYLQAHGVLNFPTPERAVAVVARMAEYESANQRICESANRDRERRISGETRHSPFASSLSSPFILEPDAMAWLRENGIATPPFRFAAAATEAIAGLRRDRLPDRDEGGFARHPAQVRARRRDRGHPR